ncbi:MAG: phage integrase N-terminal SAM-like domain-containing protein [Gemmatimonadaceae bacterium]
MSLRTEQAYLAWIRRYIRYHGLRHPQELGDIEIIAYLTHLAERESVTQSTQMQALSALLFLYREVMGRRVGDLRAVVRARAPTRFARRPFAG